jgi:hypothetical protein
MIGPGGLLLLVSHQFAVVYGWASKQVNN